MNDRIWINNNTWGSADSPAGWWESTTRLSDNGFKVDFYWPSGTSEQNVHVKAYPSAVLGWHWGWRMSNTNLPSQLSANRNVNTAYSYTADFGGGVGNVAYDCWLHTESNPLYENPSDEIMIWVNNTNAGPIGGVIANVNIGGANWNLHKGNIGWDVWSFIRTGNSSSGNLNIKDFTDYLRSYQGLSSAKYLTSVQFGSEIFQGSGAVSVDHYTCVVEEGLADGTYRLRNRGTGKYLDNLGLSSDGADVGQWSGSSSSNQLWTVTTVGSYRKLYCNTGGKYLDSMGRYNDGDLVGQWSSSSSYNQQWTIEHVSGNYYRFVNRANGKALDGAGQNANGSAMQQWFVNGSYNQQWELVQ